MQRCDAGHGCLIECEHDCVARWDELSFCEKRCLGPGSNNKSLKLAHKFSLSLHCSTGKQVRALFNQYLPRELAEELERFDSRIDIELRDATVDELLQELNQMTGGLVAQ